MYAPENDENRLSLTQSGTITHWLNEGADQKKLILGIASYGRSFQLDDESYHELFDRASGPGLPGPYTAEEGMLSYLEVKLACFRFLGCLSILVSFVDLRENERWFIHS